MKRPGLTLALLLTATVLSACVELQRSSESGYYGRDEEPAFSRDRRSSEREVAMSEMGLNTNRELSDREVEAINTRISLAKAEKALEGKREREQYYKNKPYIKTDRERLEFLNLDSFEARNRWLNAKGILASVNTHAPEVQALIEQNDIALGMTKQAVRDSWGEPDLVEVAGSPLYGNERWHYSEQTSSTDGYHTQHRLVYFEAGRVAGWESH